MMNVLFHHFIHHFGHFFSYWAFLLLVLTEILAQLHVSYLQLRGSFPYTTFF